MVLDEADEHAFLAFPVANDFYYKLETTDTQALIFEEYGREDGQILISLSPGVKTSEIQVDVLNEVLTWQAEKSAKYDSSYVWGDCETRRTLETVANLKAWRESVGSKIDSLELEIQPIERQLTPLYDERKAEVDIYNSLTEKIIALLDSLN